MLWKVIEGHVINPDKVTMITSEIGMFEGEGISHVIQIVMDNGVIIDADTLVFAEDVSEPARRQVLLVSLARLANYLGVGIDFGMSMASASFSDFEDDDDESV